MQKKDVFSVSYAITVSFVYIHTYMYTFIVDAKFQYSCVWGSQSYLLRRLRQESHKFKACLSYECVPGQPGQLQETQGLNKK